MQLKDYIQNNRKGKEANKLEREALNDPFLHDAIDGFDGVEGDHLHVIEQLEKQIAQPRHKRISPVWWAVAASFTLLIGISLFWNVADIKTDTLVLSEESPTVSTKETTEIAAVVEDTLQKSEKKDYAISIPKKSIATSANAVVVEDELVLESISVVEEDVSESIITENQVAVVTKPAPAATTAKPSAPKSQNRLIRGKVVDETGAPVLGASIKAENSFNATITDMEGNFSLTIPNQDKAKIEASYIGYENAKMNLSSDTVLITLKPNNLALNEVVVIGYGTKKMRSVTGAIASSQLEGKVSGLQVKGDSDFGESDFKSFFYRNKRKNICAGIDGELKATFNINAEGRAEDIVITSSNCLELNDEFKRLLVISPVWTRKNYKVRITLKSTE